MGETKFWHERLEEMLSSTRFRKLPKDSKFFLRSFESELRRRLGNDANSGDRSGVASPFQTALIETLRSRNITPDTHAATVKTPIGNKHSDVSFVYRKKLWIMELKTGLSFNSLGAAVWEALLFRSRYPDSRFTILALYDLFPKIEDPYAIKKDIAKILRRAGTPLTEDLRLFVLSRPPRFVGHDMEQWIDFFADGVESFVEGLPNPKSRSV
ncbi:hypothetical protein [Myxococcus sp. AB056]|uniref:hypothetical protein n=1 Tax=Myxococcus sp. AB056 TaxID=2562792 RepID=UPI0011465DCF|nr:hypothetical protein [Myxococcus sp. AB056]